MECLIYLKTKIRASIILKLSVHHPAQVFKVGERLNATIVEIDRINGLVALENGSLA
jgi:hypothetical protein